MTEREAFSRKRLPLVGWCRGRVSLRPRQRDDGGRTRGHLAPAEQHARVVLREGDLAAVGEAHGLLHAQPLQREEELLVGAVEDVDPHAVAAARGDAPRARFDGAGLGAVDRLAVGAQPLAHGREALERRRRERSVGLRADVEQQVGAAPGRTDQIADEPLGRLVVLVGDAVAPHAVHRLAGLERQAADLLPREPGGVLARQVALEGLRVLALEGREVVVVDDEAGGL